MDPLMMVVIVAVWWLRGGYEHARKDYGRSRQAAVTKAVKGTAKGSPAAKKKAAAATRHHAAGYWTREVTRGLPVTRRGLHAGWLAHKTAKAHSDALHFEARADHQEAQAGAWRAAQEHRRRMAEVIAEQEAVFAGQSEEAKEQSPRQQAKAVADEVAERRRQKAEREAAKGSALPVDGTSARDPQRTPEGTWLSDGSDPCGDCGGAGCQWCTGHGHGTLCIECGQPGSPDDPLLATTSGNVHQSHRDDERATSDLPEDHELSSWLAPGQPRCRTCDGRGRGDGPLGNCQDCRGFGSAPGDPDAPRAPDGAICAACGRPGTDEDPVLAQPDGKNIHRSHIRKDIADRTDRGFPQGTSPAAASTGGEAPVADTNYTTLVASAKAQEAQAGDDAAMIERRKQGAFEISDEMAGLNVDPETMAAQGDLTDLYDAAIQAMRAIGEQAGVVASTAQRNHGGIQAAVTDAPIAEPAHAGFYGGE